MNNIVKEEGVVDAIEYVNNGYIMCPFSAPLMEKRYCVTAAGAPYRNSTAKVLTAIGGLGGLTASYQQSLKKLKGYFPS